MFVYFCDGTTPNSGIGHSNFFPIIYCVVVLISPRWDSGVIFVVEVTFEGLQLEFNSWALALNAEAWVQSQSHPEKRKKNGFTLISYKLFS